MYGIRLMKEEPNGTWTLVKRFISSFDNLRAAKIEATKNFGRPPTGHIISINTEDGYELAYRKHGDDRWYK